MAWTPSTPTVGELELFATVLDTGSLSQAAAVHGISQPAASARIRGLERRLGVQLVDRSTAGSTPTAAGLSVGAWTAAVLDALATLRDGVAALHTEVEQLRVIASYTVAEHLLPGWLATFHRDHPAIGTELRVANSAVVEREVRAGAADVGFLEGPQRLADLHTMEVARDELVVVVPPDHPWARRRRPVALRALATTPLVVRETGSGTRETLDLLLGRHGLTPVAPALELGSTVAVKSAVLAGSGPAVLSRLAVEGELATGRLIIVDLDAETMTRSLRAVWSRAIVPSSGATALLRQLGLPSPGRGGHRRSRH
jgi:DNA-binding transcriptional LysR family regulator